MVPLLLSSRSAVLTSHPMVGCSTGYMDDRRGEWPSLVEEAAHTAPAAVELSALSEGELPGLLSYLAAAPRLPFRFISVHGPSKGRSLSDEQLVEELLRLPVWISVVVLYPDVIEDVGAFGKLGRRLAIENMDARKDGGQDAGLLADLFGRSAGQDKHVAASTSLMPMRSTPPSPWPTRSCRHSPTVLAMSTSAHSTRTRIMFHWASRTRNGLGRCCAAAPMFRGPSKRHRARRSRRGTPTGYESSGASRSRTSWLARDRTADELAKVRADLAAGPVEQGVSTCVFGSWARQELTEGSDDDWAVVVADPFAAYERRVTTEFVLASERLGQDEKKPGSQPIELPARHGGAVAAGERVAERHERRGRDRQADSEADCDDEPGFPARHRAHLTPGRAGELQQRKLAPPPERDHHQGVDHKLGIATAPDDHRRVLAVLAYVRSEPDR